jgi:hypothetical protein
MEIINGQEVERTWVYGNAVGSHVYTYTDSHTVTESQSGATLVMNSNAEKTFTLPAGTADNLGLTFTFVNINTGTLIVATAGASSDKIADSAANGNISSTDDTDAQVTIRLVAANQWVIMGALGTWTASA